MARAVEHGCTMQQSFCRVAAIVEAGPPDLIALYQGDMRTIGGATRRCAPRRARTNDQQIVMLSHESSPSRLLLGVTRMLVSFSYRSPQPQCCSNRLNVS